jgi:hypothetical protein
MTSQEQVLPSVEKILMYDDYGATTYIELWIVSILYRLNKIDSNSLKHPLVPTCFGAIYSPSSENWHQNLFKTYVNKLGHNLPPHAIQGRDEICIKEG